MDYVELIKSKILLSSWVTTQGIKLTKKGSYLSGLCPFHNEKTPSFTVNDDRYYCFGCGAHGDIFQFVTDMEGISFREALEKLAEFCHIQLPQHKNEQRFCNFKLLDEASQWFSQQLRTHRCAVEYLKSRNISVEILKKFQLGYAPRQGLKSYLLTKGFKEREILESKLMIKGIDFFRERLIFPIYNRTGRVLAFGGRVLTEKQQPKYLNSPESEIFKKKELLYGINLAFKAIKLQKQVIVVEGYFDVLGLHQAGIENVVAPLGTAISATQIQNLWELASEIIICMDGDNAGKAATLKALETIMPTLRPQYSVKFVILPPGNDPYDIVSRDGQETMLSLIKNAKSLSDFLWQFEVAKITKYTPEQYSFLEDNLNKHTKRITDQYLARHYYDFFRDQVRQLKKKAYRNPIAAPVEGIDVMKLQSVQTETTNSQCSTIVRIIIEFPELLEDPKFFEQFAYFDLVLPYLKQIQQSILKIIGESNGPLVSSELRNLLKQEGLSKEVDQLLSMTINVDPICQNLEQAKLTWHSITMLIELENIKKEEMLAIAANNVNLAEYLQKRILDINEQLML